MQDIFPAFMKSYVPLFSSILIAIAIFVLGWMASKLAARLIQKGFRKAKFDEALARFLSNLGRYVILAATVITAMGAVGVQTTSLVALFASAGLAVALALQGSLSNFASGVMILFFRPFSLGDIVTVAGNTGKVDDIGIFTTHLLTPNNEIVIIPNGKVTGDIIVNLTAKGYRRGAVEVGIAYGADVLRVLEVLRQAAARAKMVLADPAPSVFLSGLGDGAMKFTVFAWSLPPDYLDMLHNLRQCVYEEIHAAGIELPTQTINVRQLPG